MSAQALHRLKELAWQTLPTKIIMADKRVVEIDKSSKESIVIPDEDAQEIIRVAYLTARAHKCDLQEQVIQNRDALLNREKAKDKWSEAQLHYINTLHLFTVQLLTGNVEVVESGKGDKGASSGAEKGEETETAACSDDEKQRIIGDIETRVRSAQKSSG